VIEPIGTLVRPALRKTGRLAGLLCAAMRNDPLHRYFCAGLQDHERIGLPLFRLIVQYGIRQGNLLATSARLEGIAYWQTPHDASLVGIPQVVLEGLRLLKAAGLTRLARMVRTSRTALRLRRRLAPFPHWYLGFLAVDPRHQGKGHASALLKPVLARLRSEGLPCYLETHRQENVEMYEHFGFRVLETLELPGSHVRQWCMLKDG
jgi:ribosomal protein S18 acetylase RimI-like enzyme